MEVTVNQPGETEVTRTDAPKVVNGVVSITLNDGRQVGIRRMGPMDQMRMCSIIGAENSRNEVYQSISAPAYCVASIDGEPIPRPQTVLALEAVAERIGDAGLLQITLAIAEHFPNEEVKKLMEDFKKRQEIKNL